MKLFLRKNIVYFSVSVFLLSVMFSLSSFAETTIPEEKITIITYYPAPYGIYNELRSRRMAIGDEYVETPMPEWGAEISDGVAPGSADIRLQIAMGNGYLSFGDLKQTGSNCYGFTVSDEMDINDGSQLAGVWVADTGTVPYDLQITNFKGGGIILNTGEQSGTGRQYPIYMQTGASGADQGNVGIGTTDPQMLLHIKGTSNGSDAVAIRIEDDGTSNCGLGLWGPGGVFKGGIWTHHNDKNLYIKSSPNDEASDIILFTKNSAETMRIKDTGTSDGRVGINTDDPKATLEISGR